MLGKYRLTLPTLAMISVDGHHEALTVPTGTIVDLNGKTFNGDRLMDVGLEGRTVMMFTSDLRTGSVPA